MLIALKIFKSFPILWKILSSDFGAAVICALHCNRAILALLSPIQMEPKVVYQGISQIWASLSGPLMKNNLDLLLATN